MTTKKQRQRSPHHTPSDTFTCPLTAAWRRWDLLGLTYRSGCPDGSAERVAEAKNVSIGKAIKRLRPWWEVASDDVSIKPLSEAEVGRDPSHWAKNTPSHVHTEFVEHGHVVHIDVVAATRYGPGRSFWEARVFIDGQLAGRGGKGGCSLGGGGSDLPAVARLGVEHAIVVADGSRGWPRGFDAASLRPVVTLCKIIRGGASRRGA